MFVTDLTPAERNRVASENGTVNAILLDIMRRAWRHDDSPVLISPALWDSLSDSGRYSITMASHLWAVPLASCFPRAD